MLGPSVPNANVLQRALWIRCGATMGTAFSIEVESRQFLVTAQHVIRERAKVPIELAYDGRWQPLVHSAIICPDPVVDIAVIVPRLQLTLALEYGTGSEGVRLGQQLFALGFPYAPSDLSTAGTPYLQHHGGPLPYVKSATLASFLKAPGPGHVSLLLDTYVNEGFSGAPLVGFASGDPKIRIVGVVSHYVPEGGRLAATEDQLSPRRHPGLVVALDIAHAIDAIWSADPTSGAPLDPAFGDPPGDRP
jgi:hypothetical protein